MNRALQSIFPQYADEAVLGDGSDDGKDDGSPDDEDVDDNESIPPPIELEWD